MPGERRHTLWCFVEHDHVPFEVIVYDSTKTDGLKATIKEKKQKTLSDVDASNLQLWKLTEPEPVEPDDNLGQRISSRGDLPTFATKLTSTTKMSTLFPGKALEDHVYIVVRLLPTMLSIPISRMGSNPPIIQAHWTPRHDTVHSLYTRLVEFRLIQVRGTPGSGKTTLMELIHNHILSNDPKAIVEVIKVWPPKESGTTIQDRMHQNIKTYPSDNHSNSYLLFDNAQDTYWDGDLWDVFFKDVVQHRSGPCAILFCSYGSPSPWPVEHDNGTPLVIPNNARVSLTPYHDDTSDLGFPPIGLLFSRKEFDEALDCFRGPNGDHILLDGELRQMLFEWTQGHAGAVGDLLSVLSRVERQKLRHGGTLICDDLLKMQQAGKPLSDLPNFSRGLPSVDDLCKPAVATTFRKLLTQCYIIASGNSDEDYCHRHGWMHSELHQGKTCYVFASLLHAMYVSWQLIPTITQCPYSTVRDMTFSILKKFNPSQLSSPSRIGLDFSDFPLEARYQFEFYRGLFATTGGGVCICPELFTAPGACKGRIDFFVPDKKWGIELTQEGSTLSEHSSRFDPGGKYGVWLTSNDMVDYILLDCRTDVPKKANPYIQNLFHAVFEDNFRQLIILNNMLQIVEGPFALLEVSSVVMN